MTASAVVSEVAAEALCLLSIAARLREVFLAAVPGVPAAVPPFAWANQTVEDQVVEDQVVVVARSGPRRIRIEAQLDTL